MSEFDFEVWKERAWDRYKRSLLSGRPAHEIEPEWAIDLLAIGDLEKLVAWCKDRKVKVLFAKKQNGTYYFASKEVVMSSRLSPRNQVIVLLHECGHHLIGDKEDHGRFAMGYPCASDPVISKTFHHRVSCLEEEIEAWNRGWRLAERLGLCVDRGLFDQYRLKCLRTYIKWTIKPGKFDHPSSVEEG